MGRGRAQRHVQPDQPDGDGDQHAPERRVQRPVAPRLITPPPPGTPLDAGLQPLLHLAGRDKVFYPERSDLLNRIGAFGGLFARAEVYRGTSWVDDREAIILGYSMSSLPFRVVRDEIREVASGLYLGVVFWVGTKTINFALQFR